MKPGVKRQFEPVASSARPSVRHARTGIGRAGAGQQSAVGAYVVTWLIAIAKAKPERRRLLDEELLDRLLPRRPAGLTPAASPAARARRISP